MRKKCIAHRVCVSLRCASFCANWIGCNSLEIVSQVKCEQFWRKKKSAHDPCTSRGESRISTAIDNTVLKKAYNDAYDSTLAQSFLLRSLLTLALFPANSCVQIIRVLGETVPLPADTAAPAEGLKELIIRCKICVKLVQEVGSSVDIVIPPASLKQNACIVEGQERKWMNLALDVRKAPNEEVHLGEVVPSRIDLKERPIFKFLPSTRKQAEVDFGMMKVETGILGGTSCGMNIAHLKHLTFSSTASNTGAVGPDWDTVANGRMMMLSSQK
ncbi:hypothetical protein C8R45DRAFT_923570 [Mycena sanguinolenta]|nr:hypothetical protein C8R45DRAFT_923570 [Mycena sanguinolenta]